MKSSREFDLPGLQQWAQEWATSLKGDEIFLLYGEVGAGKTAFVNALGQALGLSMISSPTYALHQRYFGVQFSLDHYDLYRLETVEDLVSIGFYDTIQNRAIVCIEWAERLTLMDLPVGRRRIEIYFHKQGQRGQIRMIEWQEFPV